MLGFTLIELVITLILLGFLSAAIIPIVTSTMRADVIYTNRAAAKDSLRYAAERLALELSAMGYDKTTSQFNIQSVGANTVTFTRPVLTLQSGALVEGVIPVKICDSGPSVLLTYANPSPSGCDGQVLIDRLASESALILPFSLTWKDAAGNQLSPTAPNFKNLVRKVDVVISVGIDPDGTGQSFETIKKSVDLTSRI